MEIRSFHRVKIILWQSGPIYSFFTSSMLIPRPPPSSHAGRLAALDPAKASQGPGSLHLPLPSHPTQSWLPVIVLAQDVSPLQRELSRHTSEGAPQGFSSMSLFSFSVCVALATFCYFLVYRLLLLPESKLSKSEDPSVTVSPASKPPDTFKNKLLDEWEKLTVTPSPLYSSEMEACEGYGISPQSQSDSSTSGFQLGQPVAQVRILYRSDALLPSTLLSTVHSTWAGPLTSAPTHPSS